MDEEDGVPLEITQDSEDNAGYMVYVKERVMGEDKH